MSAPDNAAAKAHAQAPQCPTSLPATVGCRVHARPWAPRGGGAARANLLSPAHSRTGMPAPARYVRACWQCRRQRPRGRRAAPCQAPGQGPRNPPHFPTRGAPALVRRGRMQQVLAALPCAPGATVPAARPEGYTQRCSPMWHQAPDAAICIALMLEGAQGTSLSLHHGCYPHVTSRKTAASGRMADAGVAPGIVRRVVMVTRTRPLRAESPRDKTLGSWPSTARHGLVSATALLDRCRTGPEERRAIESQIRPEGVEIACGRMGRVVIRDQKPLKERTLARLLPSSMSVAQCCRLLNERTFLWAGEGRLNAMLNARAYRGRSHDVLTADRPRGPPPRRDHALAHQLGRDVARTRRAQPQYVRAHWRLPVRPRQGARREPRRRGRRGLHDQGHQAVRRARQGAARGQNNQEAVEEGRKGRRPARGRSRAWGAARRLRMLFAARRLCSAPPSRPAARAVPGCTA